MTFYFFKNNIVLLLILAVFSAVKFSSPDSVFAQSCGPNSAARCQSLNDGDVCDPNNVPVRYCVYIASIGGCSCTTTGNNPTVTPPSLPSSTPPPVVSPTFPPTGWFAPDGSPCNRTNYHTFFTSTSCTGSAGYSTENITPQSQCSRDGTGKCFKTAGQSFNSRTTSYWRYDNQSCIPITSPYVPVSAF